MDALILSCSTGGGHDAAGHAILEELRRRGHHTVMLNPYELKSATLAERIDNTYIGIVQKAPRLFGAIYKAGQLYRRLPVRSPVYFANGAMVPVMQNYLAGHHFDIVMISHPFPAEIMTSMKQRGIAIPRTMFITTDYTCIPFIEETKCDAYVIPSAELLQEFIGRGIPADRLYPLGIPVDRRFTENETREEARLRLGLKPDKKYILVAGGSMGGGKIEKAVVSLMSGLRSRPDTALIILCGHNKKLFRKLQSAAGENTAVLEYTDDMAGYMRASDLFITKPGGLSSTEAAVRGIPILHTSAIPGCETANAAFFRQYGMSVCCNSSKDSLCAMLEKLENETICEGMIQNQRKVIAADAAVKICELAETLIT